jgi:hypothetical protein
MKRIIQKLREFLAQFKERSFVSRSETDLKVNRPPWTGRLLSTGFDLGIYSMLFYALTSAVGLSASPYSSASLILTFPAYYMITEMVLGRSFGKIFLGYRMSTPETVGNRGILVVRGLMRFIPVLNFFMMLSWRRVTVLDALSYVRVYSPSSASRKKSSKSRHRTTATSSSEQSEKSPPRPLRGFDPTKLDR